MSPADTVGYVGHATVLLDLDGTRVLTDPILRRRVGPLRRHGGPPPRGLPQEVDAVLISHLHRDHADLPSLRKLPREVPMIVPAGAGTMFERRGFVDVSELAPGESARVGTVEVSATEAHHSVKPRSGAGAGAVGFLLEGGGRRVYFAGDTDLFEGMADLGEDLDLALLPVWGWGPSLGPGHLDPERAAQAAALLSPRLAVPIHWGTLYPFGLATIKPVPLALPPHRFAARLRELAPQVEARVLDPGESTSLP